MNRKVSAQENRQTPWNKWNTQYPSHRKDQCIIYAACLKNVDDQNQNKNEKTKAYETCTMTTERMVLDVARWSCNWSQISIMSALQQN